MKQPRKAIIVKPHWKNCHTSKDWPLHLVRPIEHETRTDSGRRCKDYRGHEYTAFICNDTRCPARVLILTRELVQTAQRLMDDQLKASAK